jgi:hypothetical protein
VVGVDLLADESVVGIDMLVTWVRQLGPMTLVADEGMTCGSSIFAYLVFGPGRASIEGIARPTKIIAWRGLGARLDVQGKDSRRPSWIRIRLGFVQTDSICTLLGGQSRDPTFAYKRLGGRSCSG